MQFSLHLLPRQESEAQGWPGLFSLRVCLVSLLKLSFLFFFLRRNKFLVIKIIHELEVIKKHL